MDINECKFFFCKNGVICLNIYGFYNCKCRKEWIGIYCDKDVNECLNNLCFKNIMCINRENGYFC